jgi:hypothetical protein
MKLLISAYRLLFTDVRQSHPTDGALMTQNWKNTLLPYIAETPLPPPPPPFLQI